MTKYYILKNIANTYFLYPIYFIVVIIFLTLIFSGIYSRIADVNYNRTVIELFELYGGFIINIFTIIYKILTIPYIIIKALIDVLSKFAIIFYFIINLFNGLTSFIYDVTSVEM
jgi:hypothetical protein